MFYSILLSLFSPSFYQEVGKRWRGRSFAYLLLVMAIAWLIVAYFFTQTMCKFINQYSKDLALQMPVIQLEAGVITTHSEKPIFVRWPNGNIFLIVDTQSEVKNFSQLPGTILMQKDGYLIKLGQGKAASHYSYGRTTKTLYPKDWAKLIQELKIDVLLGVFFSTFFIGLIFMYLFWIIASLVLSLIGRLIGGIFRRDVSYAGVFSITLVAATPLVIVWTVLTAADVVFPYQRIIYLVALIVYLLYGILVQPSRQKH